MQITRTVFREDHEMLRTSARRFLERECVPKQVEWDKAGKVTSARVTVIRAHSPGEKAGLRVGDELVRIDDRDVVGMPHEELARILAADLSPEHPIEVYAFVGPRLIGEEVKVNWKFTYKP